MSVATIFIYSIINYILHRPMHQLKNCYHLDSTTKLNEPWEQRIICHNRIFFLSLFNKCKDRNRAHSPFTAALNNKIASLKYTRSNLSWYFRGFNYLFCSDFPNKGSLYYNRRLIFIPAYPKSINLQTILKLTNLKRYFLLKNFFLCR